MQHVFIISELAQFFQAKLIHEKTRRISLRNCLADILYDRAMHKCMQRQIYTGSEANLPHINKHLSSKGEV